MNISKDEIYRMVFKDYPDLMDVKQISELFGVSTKKVYQLIDEGTLPSIKIGREYRIMKVRVMEYLNVFDAAAEAV